MGQLRYNLVKNDLKNIFECKSIYSSGQIAGLPIATTNFDEAIKNTNGVIMTTPTSTHLE